MSSTAATSTKENKTKPPREYNPRWRGYVFIIITSLVCLSSVSNVSARLQKGQWAASISFASFTFAVSFLVMVFDRFQLLTKYFNYTKACDGKLEGRMLGFFVLLWVVTVGILTSPGGLAYHASNIYFSSWGTLISCVYTLDQWTSSKDIISIQELTQLSATLKSWYALFLFSLIVFGSAVSMHIYLDGRHVAETAFAISLGIISTLVALFFILVHYKFFSGCCARIKQGGWLELSIAFFLILCWTIGVALLTQEGGIASTMSGSGCTPSKLELDEIDNCTVFVGYSLENGTLVEGFRDCEVLYEEDIPGSNLYFCSWGALLASVNICARWKAAQALQFAQAAQRRQATLPENEDDVVEAEEDDDAI